MQFLFASPTSAPRSSIRRPAHLARATHNPFWSTHSCSEHPRLSLDRLTFSTKRVLGAVPVASWQVQNYSPKHDVPQQALVPGTA